MEPSPTIRIKIKTLDNSLHIIEIPRDTTINELKLKIEQDLKIPISRQRLIFQGRLLQGFDKISVYKLEEGHVIHLIAQSQPDQNTLNNPNNNQNPLVQPPINNTLNNNNQDSELFNGLYRSINENSTNRRNTRRKHLQQRVNGFNNSNLNEAKEVLRQNLTTVQQILSSFVNINEFSVGESFNIFGFHNRKLHIGQWVDVKEESDQWLEAQVFNISNTQALIRYNGWGNRFDEWIDMNSIRIAPFRTHTIQTANSTFLSPNPNNLDSDRKYLGNNFDLHDFLYEFGLTLSQIFGILLNINLKTDKSERSEQGGLIKTHENNDIDMKSLINGMIEEQKQNDPKFYKYEIDVASLKSLKSVEKNSIDYDASSMKSIKSYISNSNWSKYQEPTLFKGYISEEVEEESQGEEEDVSDFQSNAPGPSMPVTKELENYLIASQVAPLLDRMGRLMIDISPLMAMFGTNLQNHFPNNVANNHNNSNISIMTNEGSIISNQILHQNNNINNNNQKGYVFQVPIMLTPSEMLNNFNNNYFMGNGMENSVDIHIHTFMNPNQIPAALNLNNNSRLNTNSNINPNPNVNLNPNFNSNANPNPNPNPMVNLAETNMNPNPQNNININNCIKETKNIGTNTEDEISKFEEEKIQYLKKLKEKTNFAQIKQNLSNQNETLSESNRLKDFFVEKDNLKPKYIHSIENLEHKEPKHVSFRGLKRFEEKNRFSLNKPSTTKNKYNYNVNEKDIIQNKPLKKNIIIDNTNKNSNNEANNLTPFKSNQPPNNPSNINSNSSPQNNTNNSRVSNCGRQIY